MPSSERLAWERSARAILLAVGLALVAGNLWCTAARSTIPLALDTTVLSRETRREKHPGTDDVFLWHTADGRTLPVDRAVTESVPRDRARVEKQAFSKTLLYDGQPVRLAWSPDFRGMRWTMAVAVVLLLGMSVRRPSSWHVN